MHRVLLEVTIGDRSFPIIAYWVFALLGFVAFYCLGRKAVTRQGFTVRQYHTCLTSMFGLLIIGERLTHLVNHPEQYRGDWLKLFSLDGGLVLYGGLLMTFAGGYFVCRFLQIDYWRFMDALAPGIGIGMCIGYLGCFLNGCCFGLPTTVPWGVVFPPDSIPNMYYSEQYRNEFGDTIFTFLRPLSLHPTQIYKGIASLAAGLTALCLLGRRAKPGVPFLAFLFVYYTLRAYITQWQAVTIQNEAMLMILPYVLVGVVSLIALMLWWRMKHGVEDCVNICRMRKGTE